MEDEIKLQPQSVIGIVYDDNTKKKDFLKNHNYQQG